MPKINAYQPKNLERIYEQVRSLRHDALALEIELDQQLSEIALNYRRSARNLVHYLAVRQHDLRDLQRDLQVLGLSSLGRLEGRVLPVLNAVLVALCYLRDLKVPAEFKSDLEIDLAEKSLQDHAINIFGQSNPQRDVKIMVTMPDQAASDPVVIERMLGEGMDAMRINCAHDNRGVWAQMLENKRQAEGRLGRHCKVAFDLVGPKLRTGPIEAGPEILKVKPGRDVFGRTVIPARVLLGTHADQIPYEYPFVPVDASLLEHAQVGDELRFHDARDRERFFQIRSLSSVGLICEADRTCYIASGTVLTLRRNKEIIVQTTVGKLPATEQAIALSVGDRLLLTEDRILGQPAKLESGQSQTAHIGCTLSQVFEDARVGERILFDDGKLEGLIRKTGGRQLEVEITHAARGRVKLGAEKGINLPDTTLHLQALSPKDLEDLEFIVKHADMVSLSFVRSKQDIKHFIEQLERLKAQNLGIILKIENRQAFEALPELLLAALRHPPVAVMIARGDLGVEVGFERLAEVQEEILWLCEAAHIPVIWATQVLEELAKNGLPTRAEVTDAAMAGRAECVMLNKGPYIEAAIGFLDDVLQRMQQHQSKKTSMLRRLEVSGHQKIKSKKSREINHEHFAASSKLELS